MTRRAPERDAPWPASLRRIFRARRPEVGNACVPDTIDHATSQDTEEVEHRLAEYQLNTSDGKPAPGTSAGSRGRRKRAGSFMPASRPSRDFPGDWQKGSGG